MSSCARARPDAPGCRPQTAIRIARGDAAPAGNRTRLRPAAPRPASDIPVCAGGKPHRFAREAPHPRVRGTPPLSCSISGRADAAIGGTIGARPEMHTAIPIRRLPRQGRHQAGKSTAKTRAWINENVSWGHPQASPGALVGLRTPGGAEPRQVGRHQNERSDVGLAMIGHEDRTGCSASLAEMTRPHRGARRRMAGGQQCEPRSRSCADPGTTNRRPNPHVRAHVEGEGIGGERVTSYGNGRARHCAPPRGAGYSNLNTGTYPPADHPPSNCNRAHEVCALPEAITVGHRTDLPRSAGAAGSSWSPACTDAPSSNSPRSDHRSWSRMLRAAYARNSDRGTSSPAPDGAAHQAAPIVGQSLPACR